MEQSNVAGLAVEHEHSLGLLIVNSVFTINLYFAKEWNKIL